MGIIYLSPPNGDRFKPICIFWETILKSCLSILCFLSFLYPSKFYKKMWTGGQVGKILRKQFQPHLFHHLKVWTVGKKLYFYFMFSFWQKVWTGGKVMKILKKNSFNLMYILIWKCGHADKKLFFYFMFSFCYVPFTILTKKCGQVD